MTTESGLDGAALSRLRRLGGDRLVREMIGLFLRNAPERLAAAREGRDAGDGEAVRRAAHSLKSTAANVGAAAMQAVAERIERLAVEGRGEAAAALVDELAAAFDRVRPVLETEAEEAIA